jgi:hypothetical protein
MKNRSKRKPQQRETIGKTKAYILVFLLEGEKDRTEISEYMKIHHNLINRSNIKDHLYGLVEMGFIEQGEKKPGKPRPYLIKKGFDHFKKIFNYLMENGLVQDLMKTKYFSDTINANDFPIKLWINSLKQLSLYQYEQIVNDKTDSTQLTQHEKELNLLPIIEGKTASQYAQEYYDRRDAYKIDDKENPYVRKRDYILNIYNNNTIDQLADKTSLDLIGPFIEMFFPQEDMGKVRDILKTSPTANDIILNIEKHNPVSFLGLLVAYQAYKKYFESIGQKVGDPSPIVTLLESAYRMDYAQGKIQETDFSLSIFKKLYLPNLEGDVI